MSAVYIRWVIGMWPVWVSFAGSVPCSLPADLNRKHYLSLREEGREVALSRRAVAPEGGRGGVQACQSCEQLPSPHLWLCHTDIAFLHPDHWFAMGFSVVFCY